MVRPGSALPRLVDSFVGRAAELETLKTLLATHRLVTLTGPAGIGKSRLAIQVAEQLGSSFADGAVFVPLVALTDPARVPQAVAATLGLREEPDRRFIEMLIDFLASRSLLLVWDNCDHVVDGCRALAKRFDVPTLIIHGDDDQIVPIGAAALLSSRIVKEATLKIYPGAPHGLPSTLKDQVNADLLAFFKA